MLPDRPGVDLMVEPLAERAVTDLVVILKADHETSR